MIQLRREDRPDVPLYLQRMQEHGYITMERDKVLAAVEYDQLLSMSILQQAKDIMRHSSCLNYCSTEREIIARYLSLYEGCPDHYFRTSSGKVSLDASRVLNPLLQNGYAEEFLTKYMQYKSMSSKCSKIIKMFDRQNISAGPSHNNEELIKIPFNAELQVNERVAFHQEDVIGIPKEYVSAISPEDDYLLAWGDFAQSDFRVAYNLYLRDSENIKVFNKYEDKYEAMARIVFNSRGEEFSPERFKNERALYKRNVLATINGSRGAFTKRDREFIQEMSIFLHTCPRYVELENRIKDRIELGLPVYIDSYFGHTEMAAVDIARPVNTLNFALNSPLQSTTAELVIFISNYILDSFYALGYTSDDISLYFTRHDEPLFKLKPKVLKDSWIFKNVETILVDDWSPLKIDFSFGYNYKVVDEELTNLYKKSIEENAKKIVQIPPCTEKIQQFYPIVPTCVLYTHFQTVGSKTVLSIYNDREYSVNHSLHNTSDPEKMQSILVKKILDASEQIVAHGYNGIIVYNMNLDLAINSDFSFIKFVKRIDQSMSKVCVLSDYACTLYAKSIKNDFYKPPLLKDEEFVKGVGKLEYV